MQIAIIDIIFSLGSVITVVGSVLIANAFDVQVPKGYVYFAMAFSLAVEAVNIRMRGARAGTAAQGIA